MVTINATLSEPSKLSLQYETNYIRKIDLHHFIYDHDELGSSYFSKYFQSSVDFLTTLDI